LSAKLVNTLKVNTELDFPYAPQRPPKTSSVPIDVDVGFKLPYMPLSCFTHLTSCFVTNETNKASQIDNNEVELKGAWLGDLQDLPVTDLQMSALSLGVLSFESAATPSSLTVSDAGGSNNRTTSHPQTQGHTQDHEHASSSSQKDLSMSEERMAMLFQKPVPHIESHLQRNLVYQSGYIPTQIPTPHNGEPPYRSAYNQDHSQYQQQQQQQPFPGSALYAQHQQHNVGGGGHSMLTKEQQQWQQQQVVAASAKKQQIVSRQIGKLQPQMPHQQAPLFSNARYNPTSRRKPDAATAIDPVIAATAASIAASASAALKEVSVAPGVVVPLNMSSPPQQYAQMPYPHQQQQAHIMPNRTQQQQHYPVQPIQSYQQQPRPQQQLQLPTQQMTSSSWQQSGNDSSHNQAFNAGETFIFYFYY
jgi:hypothetical protein